MKEIKQSEAKGAAKMNYEIVKPNTDLKLYTNGKRKFSTVNPGNWVVAQFATASEAYKALNHAPLDYRVYGISK